MVGLAAGAVLQRLPVPLTLIEPHRGLISDPLRSAQRHEGKNGWVKIAYVLITHYAVAFLTLNNDAGGACGATLIPLYIMVFVTAGYTWKIARLTYKKAA